VTGLRIAGWVAAGLVIGFVLGGMAADRDRGALEREVARLERSLRHSRRPNVLESFLPRLGGGAAPEQQPREATTVQAGEPPLRVAPGDAGVAPADPRPPASGDVAVVGRFESSPQAPAPATTQPEGERGGLEVRLGGRRRRSEPSQRAAVERFEDIARVQRARAAASRLALIEQAGLDEAQVQRVDTAVERMNGQLSGYGEEMIVQLVEQKAPSPAQALGLGHDISGILLDGQKEIDAVVGEAAEQVEPSALEIWNYVDVEQWRPLVEQHLQGLEVPGAAPEAQPQPGSAGAGAVE